MQQQKVERKAQVYFFYPHLTKRGWTNAAHSAITVLKEIYPRRKIWLKYSYATMIMIIVSRKGENAFSRLVIQPYKKPVLAFCTTIISTEIDKFHL